MIWRHSIAVRLSLAFALLAVVVFSSLGIYLGRSADSHMAELDSHELLGKLALARHVGGQERSAAGMAVRLADALVGEHGLVVAVDGKNGAIFAWPDAESAAEVAAAAGMAGDVPRRIAIGRRDFRVAAGSLETGWGESARIVVARDIHHHTDFLDRLQRDYWIALTGALLLMVAIGAWVAQRGMRPLREIAQAAGHISAGKLSARIPEQDVPPELAAMVSAFNDMLARLEESFVRLSGFSADLAHELRTPIHNLRMQTEVSLGKIRTSEEYRDLLASNLEEYARLSAIIADMLFLAKADHGLVTPPAGHVPLLPLCRRLIEYYGLLAENIAIELTGDDLMARGDRLMLERAVGNVLLNAIHHTPAAGSITVRSERERDFARLSVTNSGQPIPAEALEQVFERFVRLDPASEGSGLGLAIARSIARAHGGDISVQSAGGRTTFCIRLPCADTAAPAAPVPA